MRGAALLFLVLVHGAVASAQIADFASTDFSKADSLADAYTDHPLQDFKSLAHKLTHPFDTEQEKFRAIYKWVCNNIGYDYTLFKKQKKARTKIKDAEALARWNRNFTNELFKELITAKQTICTGYAYLVKELSFHAGLSCEVVNGYGRSSQNHFITEGDGNHSWNAILINNKWYLCDATWASGYYDPTTLQFIKKYDDSFFLADPALFVHKHFPLNERWLLLPDKPSLNDFLQGPVVYAGATAYNILKFSPGKFDIVAPKGKEVAFTMTFAEVVENQKPKLKIHMPNGSISICENIRHHDNTSALTHTFTEKGMYVVHLLVGDSYICSYRVAVK